MGGEYRKVLSGKKKVREFGKPGKCSVTYIMKQKLSSKESMINNLVKISKILNFKD